MADVFISYVTPDLEFATAVADRCNAEGLSVFLAPVSVTTGGDWTEEIHDALRASPWVVFLASKVAIEWPYVQGTSDKGQDRRPCC